MSNGPSKETGAKRIDQRATKLCLRLIPQALAVLELPFDVTLDADLQGKHASSEVIHKA